MECITASLLSYWSEIEPHRCYQVNGSNHFILFIKQESFLIAPYLYSEPTLPLKDQIILQTALTYAIKQDADLTYQISLIRGQHTIFKSEILDSYFNITGVSLRKDSYDSLLESYITLRRQQYLLNN